MFEKDVVPPPVHRGTSTLASDNRLRAQGKEREGTPDDDDDNCPNDNEQRGMEAGEDEDVCRVCRGGPEPGAPLFHPCKCSGSIRYCHQDCLIEWLQHSRKKYCELCSHPFTFHKVYSPSMPAHLPAYLYVRRFCLRTISLIQYVLRMLIVGFTWLAILPLLNIYVWRFYFWAGDVIAWAMIGNQLAMGGSQLNESVASNASIITNASIPAEAVGNVSAPALKSPKGMGWPVVTLELKWQLTDYNHAMRTFAHDCFEGQVLTCVVVVVFVGIFLLREWILQNMPQAAEGIPVEGAPADAAPPAARPAAAPLARPVPAAAPAQALPAQAAQAQPAATEGGTGDARTQHPAAQQLPINRLPLRARQLTNRDVPVDEGGEASDGELAGEESAQSAFEEDHAWDDTEIREERRPSAEQIARIRARRLRHFAQAGPSSTGAMPGRDNHVQVGEPKIRDNFKFNFTFETPAPVNDQHERPQFPGEGSSQHRMPNKERACTPERSNGHEHRMPNKEPACTSERSNGHERDVLPSDVPYKRSRLGTHEPSDVSGGEVRIDAEFETAFGQPATSGLVTAPSGLDGSGAGDGIGESGASVSNDAYEESSGSSAVAKEEGGEREGPGVEGGADLASEGGTLWKGKAKERDLDDAARDHAGDGSGRDDAILIAEPSAVDGNAASSLAQAQAPSSSAQSHDAILRSEGALEPPGKVAASSEGGQVNGATSDGLDMSAAPNGAEGRDETAEHADKPEAPGDAGGIDTDDDADQDQDDDEEVEDDFMGDRADEFVRMNDWEAFEQDQEQEQEEGGERLEDELDGMFEAIGMRGPLTHLVQNVALMYVLCSFVLLIFVALPYIVGKVFGMGSNVFRFIGLPIRLLRLVTDPLFDAVIHFGSTRVWPLFQSVFGSSNASSSVGSMSWSDAKVGANLGGATSRCDWVSDRATQVFRQTLALVVNRLPSMSVVASVPYVGSAIQKSVESVSQLSLRDAAESFVDAVLTTFERTIEQLEAKARGTSPSDRAFCVLVGHSYWILALGLHTAFGGWLNNGRMRWAKNAIDQQITIVKVLMFICIELVLFPLGCGVLLDICVQPLFPGASLRGMVAHLCSAPVTFFFVHWMGGTLYMFLFAQFVSFTREIVRPGVLCWIRDPNDPGFHPIREILDRKTTTQLRKIGASALMYAGILTAALGINVYALRYVVSGVLPLRWKAQEPLSHVPFDLLMLHVAMPWLIRKAKPGLMFRNAWIDWWAFASRQLRLTSFMLGGRPASEEGQHIRKTWRARLYLQEADVSTKTKKSESESTSNSDEVEFKPDGGFARVPGDDNAVLSTKIVIRTDASGAPLDQEGVEAVQAQNDAIAKMTSKPEYIIVYMPPHFRQRVILLLFFLWFSTSSTLLGLFAVPLLVGRGIFKLAMNKEVHDFYSFALGLLLLWGTVRTAKGARRAYKRVAVSVRAGRKGNAVARIGKSVLTFPKLVYLGIMFGFVIPTLLGLVVNQYVIVSLRYSTHQVPEVVLAQTWAMGLIEQQILIVALSFWSPQWLHTAVDETRRNGMRRPNVLYSTRALIAPVVLALTVLLFGPGLAVWTLGSSILPTSRDSRVEQMLFRSAYQLVLSAFLVQRAYVAASKRMDKWTSLLRDEEFLESTSLRNYEPRSGTDASNSDEEEVGAGDAALLQADGPVPDVLLR